MFTYKIYRREDIKEYVAKSKQAFEPKCHEFYFGPGGMLAKANKVTE